MPLSVGIPEQRNVSDSMNPTITSVTLEEFEAMVRAAQTLAVGGLAEDPAWFKDDVRGMAFRFDIPYGGEDKAYKILGGWPRGALHNLLRDICELSGAIAPHPEEDHEDYDRDFITVTYVAPYEVSAHEVMEAHAYLSAALKRLGLDDDYIGILLKPA